MSSSTWFWFVLILGAPAVVAFIVGGALIVFGSLELAGGVLIGLMIWIALVAIFVIVIFWFVYKHGSFG